MTRPDGPVRDHLHSDLLAFWADFSFSEDLVAPLIALPFAYP